MARARGAELVCHRHDDLVSYEDHHVWPQAMHGPDEPWNVVRICCNAHSDVHHLLNLMLRGKPYRLSDYGPRIRVLALDGYARVTAYAESIAARR